MVLIWSLLLLLLYHTPSRSSQKITNKRQEQIKQKRKERKIEAQLPQVEKNWKKPVCAPFTNGCGMGNDKQTRKKRRLGWVLEKTSPGRSTSLYLTTTGQTQHSRWKVGRQASMSPIYSSTTTTTTTTLTQPFPPPIPVQSYQPHHPTIPFHWIPPSSLEEKKGLDQNDEQILRQGFILDRSHHPLASLSPSPTLLGYTTLAANHLPKKCVLGRQKASKRNRARV